MNPIRPVILDDNSVFWELAPGKPNPHETCMPGRDERSRVVQSAQKGGYCWYYAMNMLRVRVGKLPSESFQETRRLEKSISDLRKALLQSDYSLPFSSDALMNDSVKSLLSSLTKEKIRSAMSTGDTIIGSYYQGPNFRPLVQFFKEFLDSEFDTMLHFLTEKSLKQRREIFRAFCRPRNIDLKKVYNNSFHSPKAFKDLTSFEIDVWFNMVMRQEAVKAYDLKPVSWMPTDPFSTLFKILKESGPVQVGGSFGTTKYGEPPFKVEVLPNGIEVLGWKSTARISDVTYSQHVIVLVGAKKVGPKGYVYYLDPNDSSHPDKPEQRPVNLSN